MESSQNCSDRQNEKAFSQEQLAFYAEQEEKCRKEMKAAQKWMIGIFIIVIVFGTPILFLGGVGVYFFIAGVGFIGIIAQALCYAAHSKKLEKLQREKLFHEKK